MLTVSMLSFVTMAEETTVDALLDLILQDTGTVTTTASSGTTTPVLPAVLAPELTPAEDTEFTSAITWMHTNWLTQFSTAATFEPANLLTRQQAAKFFVMLQESYVWIPVTSNTNCAFKDTWFDSSLREFVDKACTYGIMQWQNSLFRPNAVISKPEFVASLVRIMEWAKRDETTNPWWLWYFQQARDWGLTKEQNANAFDTPMSRYESALFLYRASRMIQKPASLNTGSNTTSTTGNATNPTSTVTTGWTSTNTNQTLTSVVSDPALQEAIYWMYDNGITRYDSVENYRPFDSITRQEAAKIFTLFRNTIIQGTPDSAGANCVFTDMDLADPTLVSYITDACKLQILKWSNGLFNPLAILTKPQAVAILVRMLEWNQDETTNPRWQWYYDRAVAMWMIQQSTPTNFDKPITRYEVAMLLYNSKIKYELIKNLNNNFETNKLIYTVPDSVSTWASTGEKTGLISINTQIMERSDINGYTIDLFGEQYVLEKTATQKYLNSDYVWYGKILSLDKTTAVWTAALTMSNGVVISWVLRPYNILSKTYYITPSSKQPYYTMMMKKR